MKRTLFQELVSNRKGTIATFTALLMPIAIGGFGLGAEASYWYFAQRKLQNAADVAAFTAAAQLRVDRNQSTIESAALAAAVKTGYTTSIGTITTTWPPTSGTYAGDNNAVEITVLENHPRLFTAMFSSGDVPISGQ
jgi:Flp pilus assembly protein TadG